MPQLFGVVEANGGGDGYVMELSFLGVQALGQERQVFPERKLIGYVEIGQVEMFANQPVVLDFRQWVIYAGSFAASSPALDFFSASMTPGVPDPDIM